MYVNDYFFLNMSSNFSDFSGFFLSRSFFHIIWILKALVRFWFKPMFLFPRSDNLYTHTVLEFIACKTVSLTTNSIMLRKFSNIFIFLYLQSAREGNTELS